MSEVLLFIQPGWAENKWQVNRFRAALKPHMKLIDDAQNAQVIIAHSAACYDLPSIKLKDKLIVLIGVPYWPGRSIGIRIFQNVVLQAPYQIKRWGLLFWSKKILWNIFYIFSRPYLTLSHRKALKKDIFQSLAGNKVLLIRNKGDVYSSSKIGAIAKRHGFEYVKLNGTHEECWFNPRPYVELIEKHL